MQENESICCTLTDKGETPGKEGAADGEIVSEGQEMEEMRKKDVKTGSWARKEGGEVLPIVYVLFEMPEEKLS